jgi:hypothetical protein
LNLLKRHFKRRRIGICNYQSLLDVTKIIADLAYNLQGILHLRYFLMMFLY